MKIAWFAGLALALAVAVPALAQSADPQGGLFHVAGFGRVAWQPDLFEMAFTVITEQADADRARERHLATLAVVRGVLDEHAAALTERSEDAPRLQRRDDGYRFDSRFVLRVRGMAPLAALQQRLMQDSVSDFELRPLSQRLPEYGDRARREALRDARRKAESIAAEMGWTLGAATAVRFQDERPWWTPQTPVARQYGARAYNYAAEAPAHSGEVTAQVDVEYAYRH